MFLTAPETKGKTLEEMDEVFDSGLPAWKTVQTGSRLDQLAKDIEAGNLKIAAPTGGAVATEKQATTHTEPAPQVPTTEQAPATKE